MKSPPEVPLFERGKEGELLGHAFNMHREAREQNQCLLSVHSNSEHEDDMRALSTHMKTS